MSDRKIALITGGSRGIGRAVALALSQQGVDVVLTYRNSEHDATETTAAIVEHGGTAVAARLDIGVTDSFDAFADQLREMLQTTWGRDNFDILVNNAGEGHSAPFADTTEKDFDHLVNVHFKGVFFLTQKLLPLIADGASIVNYSTGLTRFVGQGQATYAAMKGAIEVLTRYQAQELGARGIRVNTVAPGAIASDFGGGIQKTDDFRAAVGTRTALGRIGEPDDVGTAIASLVSDANRWITAQRIEVSGGMLL